MFDTPRDTFPKAFLKIKFRKSVACDGFLNNRIKNFPVAVAHQLSVSFSRCLSHRSWALGALLQMLSPNYPDRP